MTEHYVQAHEVTPKFLKDRHIAFGKKREIECNFLYGHDETRLGFRSAKITVVSKITVETVLSSTDYDRLVRLTFHSHKTPWTPYRKPRTVYVSKKAADLIVERVEQQNSRNEKMGITLETKHEIGNLLDTRLFAGQRVQEIIHDGRYDAVTT